MKQRIAFTAFNRPGYLAETLASWRNVRGVESAFFDFHLEPSEITSDMVELIYEGAGETEAAVYVNADRLGVQRNPYHALDCVFTNSFRVPCEDDFVLLAEDDFTVASDILEYFAWASREYFSDSRVLAVSATQFEPQGGPDEVLRLAGWTGWVWGIWRDRWEKLLKPDWSFNYEHGGWDWRIIRHWCSALGYTTVAPALSRSQHIGQHGGMHTNPVTWRDHQSRCFQPDYPPQVYRRRLPDVPLYLPAHHMGT